MLNRSKRSVGRYRTEPSKAVATAGILLCLALAGCAADGVETGVDAGTGTENAASDVPEGTETSVAITEPDPPAEPAAPPLPDLMGKQRTEIIEILGRPAFSRRDRPALLLRYRQDGCILDLFLYPDSSNAVSGQAVEHIEARSATGQIMAAKGCIAAVIKARTGERQG